MKKYKEFNEANPSAMFRDKYRDYEAFYTYFSKRGYFVATNKIGNYAAHGNLECTGESEEDAIIKLKHEILKRIDDIHSYYQNKLSENTNILKSIQHVLF